MEEAPAKAEVRGAIPLDCATAFAVLLAIEYTAWGTAVKIFH